MNKLLSFLALFGGFFFAASTPSSVLKNTPNLDILIMISAGILSLSLLLIAILDEFKKIKK